MKVRDSNDRRKWMQCLNILREEKWGELPWTLPMDLWKEWEVAKMNDEIERRFKKIWSQI